MSTLVTGWYDVLLATSPSGAVWEPAGGITMPNFVSRSGRQCDGVTRMLPALAAWTAQPGPARPLPLTDGREIDARELVFNAFVHATDPDHADYWDFQPRGGRNQRQVESSIVAWSLWLSRGWLMQRLSAVQVRHIQQWLALCTENTQHWNNWSLFTAVNHGARVALAEHGFEGDLDAIRRDLLIGDELYLRDGWMWDARSTGLDYYNFWVNGSHHAYLRAMLPDWENATLDRALRKLETRCADLPFFIDAGGRNILFGRSLPYRWGWLSGLMASYYIGLEPVDAGLGRAMFARNIDAWLAMGSLNEQGVLRERLTPEGGDGGRDGYINCGHPYWGMKAWLCLALPDAHPFWSKPAAELPVEQGDFVRPRQGPGFVMRGLKRTGEVRLFNLRNQENASALYQKLAYATHFPCNADTSRHRTVWDSQFGVRLADGTAVRPRVREVDVNDGRVMHLVWEFELGPDSLATVETTLTVDGERYRTEHAIDVAGEPAAGARWVEGSFALGLAEDEPVELGGDGDMRWALAGERGAAVVTRRGAGWEAMALWPDEATWLTPEEARSNIVHGRALHFLLTAPVQPGRVRLVAEQGASVEGAAIVDAMRGSEVTV
ncbi:MAG: DUF2264 domain-containing protein [Phycisphaeraceae bacterium]